MTPQKYVVQALAGIAIVATVSMLLASTADAARPASRAQQRAILREVPRILYDDGGHLGRIAWTVVSARGPYAIMRVAARPHHRYDPSVVLLHRTRPGWRLLAHSLIEEPCDSVPRRVIHDFHTYFLRHPREYVIYRQFRTSPSCAGRLARGH